HSSLARPVGAIVIIAICLRGNIRDIAQSCGSVVQRVDHALKLLVAGDGKTVGAVSAAAAAGGISAGKDRIGPPQAISDSQGPPAPFVVMCVPPAAVMKGS